MIQLGLLHDECFKQHDTGIGHPESADRLIAVEHGLEESGWLDKAYRIKPVPVDMALLEARHDPRYIKRLKDACDAGKLIIDVPDSTICRASYDIAMLAAGGTVEAARLIASGEIKRAFCAVRPPGHHAEHDRSMGFCMFNNSALAADAVCKEFGFERVLILDWDIHHGNGTQHAFYSDPSIYYISLHGHPEYLFPGTGFAEEYGHGEGRGATLNVTFMPGAGDDDYRNAFSQHVEPAIRTFEPQMIIISVGFDPHAADPIGITSLSDGVFAEMLGRTVKLADRFAKGRVLSVLEGGYNLAVLRRCVAQHIEILAEQSG